MESWVYKMGPGQWLEDLYVMLRKLMWQNCLIIKNNNNNNLL